MDLDAELQRVIRQEQQLVLPRLDHDRVWQLGSRLRALAADAGLALVIEIRWEGVTVFQTAMAGTAPLNHDWARRKRNTAELFQQSSYRVGLQLQKDGRTLQDRAGLPLRDYAVHGGSVPLRVTGAGCVGSVTVSGAPHREDHELIARVLGEYRAT